MKIDFQLTAMAPMGSSKGKGKARANMLSSVISQCLSLDYNHIKGFISENIHGLIQIYNVCGIKDARALDFIYDRIFVDSVTTRHFSQF
jgi:hypothetical protein